MGVPGHTDTPHIFHTNLLPCTIPNPTWRRCQSTDGGGVRRDGQAGHRKHGTRSDLQDRPGPTPLRRFILFHPASPRPRAAPARPSGRLRSAGMTRSFLWCDRSSHLQFMNFSGKQEFSHCNFECVQRRTLSTQSLHPPSFANAMLAAHPCQALSEGALRPPPPPPAPPRQSCSWAGRRAAAARARRAPPWSRRSGRAAC